MNVSGTVSLQDFGQDSFSSAGTIPVLGNLTSSDGEDSADFSGSVQIKGSLSVLESGQDFADIISGSIISGVISVSESYLDSFYGSGEVFTPKNIGDAEIGRSVSLINANYSVSLETKNYTKGI